MMRYLVWIRDFAERPRPQLWPELFFGIDGRHKARIVRTVELRPGERGLDLDTLARFYPAEG